MTVNAKDVVFDAKPTDLSALGINEVLINDPRQFGVTGTYRF